MAPDRRRVPSSCSLAESFIVAGDHERGLELLERSVEGFHPYHYMAEHCRVLDPVRGTPRFEAVLARARALVETFPGRLARWTRPPDRPFSGSARNGS